METCAKVMATEHNGELVTHEDYCAPMHTMGEVGLAAIQNIRVKKQKKPKLSILPKHHTVISKFYPCNPDNKKKILKQIEQENNTHKFSGSDLFREDQKEADKWKGYRRTWAVFTYEQLETEEWGLGKKEKARVTVCYKDGQVGLILRYIEPEAGAETEAAPAP
jgi:hypothetical protein